MSGFQSPNYTQTPNDLFDELLPDMGLAELKVVMCIVRHTFGYHRDEIKISIRTMARFTGLTANSVMEGAKQAEDHGMIERYIDGNKTTLWRAVVSVVPTKTRRITRRDAGVSPTKTLLGVKERLKKDSKDIKEGASAKTDKPTKPKASDIPELVLYREVVRHWPKPFQQEAVIDAIQKTNSRLGRVAITEDLCPFFTAWGKVSGNEWSLVWLEWAETGQVPTNGTWKSQRQTSQPSDQPVRSPAELERVRAQARRELMGGV